MNFTHAPASLNRRSAVVLCFVLGIVLNTLLSIYIYPAVHGGVPYLFVTCVSRVVVGATWFGLYRLITGETGINPFVNLALNFIPLALIYYATGVL